MYIMIKTLFNIKMDISLNLRSTFSFQERSKSELNPIEVSELSNRRSIESSLKGFVPRPRPKISLISPSPLLLIPQDDLDGSLLEELDDNLTNDNTIVEINDNYPKKKQSKSLFTQKVNDWYKECNKKDGPILSILNAFSQK